MKQYRSFNDLHLRNRQVAIVNLPPRPMMGIDSCGMLISAVHHEEGEEKLHLLMVDDHIPAGAKCSTKTGCTSFSEKLRFYTNTPILHQSMSKSVQRQKNCIILISHRP